MAAVLLTFAVDIIIFSACAVAAAWWYSRTMRSYRLPPGPIDLDTQEGEQP